MTGTGPADKKKKSHNGVKSFMESDKIFLKFLAFNSSKKNPKKICAKYVLSKPKDRSNKKGALSL